MPAVLALPLIQAITILLKSGDTESPAPLRRRPLQLGGLQTKDAMIDFLVMGASFLAIDMLATAWHPPERPLYCSIVRANESTSSLC